MYKQKIKHLQHEHLNDIAELNADSLASSELMEKEQEHLEEELRKTITRVDIQEINFEHTEKELELVCRTKHTFPFTLIISIVLPGCIGKILSTFEEKNLHISVLK